jgi:hypothetical protein
MNGPLGKLIPISALLVVLGYLCWPHFETPPTPEGPSTNLPKVTDSLLRPGQPPAIARDPFGDSVPFEIGEIDEERSARRAPPHRAKGGAARTAATAPSKGTPGNAITKPTENATTRPAQDASTSPPGGAGSAPSRAVPQTLTAGKSTADEPTTGLVLNATLLYGDQQIAMINGRAYKPGDAVESAGSADPPVIRQIDHHSVVVSRAGQVGTLQYSNTSSQTVARAGAAAQGGARNLSNRRPAAAAGTTRPGTAGVPQR